MVGHDPLWSFWQLASEKGRPEEFEGNVDSESSAEDDGDSDVRHYVALGSDNAWYMFTARSVKSVHTNLAIFGEPGRPVEETLKEQVQLVTRKWEHLGRSGSGPLSCVWSADSSIDTWAWGCQVPVLSQLSSAHEVLNLTFLFFVKIDMMYISWKLLHSSQALISFHHLSVSYITEASGLKKVGQ